MNMDLDGITAETIEAVKKAQTSGVNSSTGLFGVDLTGLVSLVPVAAVTRNSIPRENSETGADVTQWRALLNINNQQPSPAAGLDYAGSLVEFDEQNVYSPYFPLALAGRVTQDAVDRAKGYANAKAVATLQTLLQLQMGENKMLLGAQNYALPAMGTVTLADSATGGTIAPSTAVYVKVCARSGYNYYYGGSGLPATERTVTTSTVAGSTHSVTASWPTIKGAFAYDVYVGAASGAEFYYTTVTAPTVTITAIPTAAQAVPTSTLPNLSSAAPAIPTADGSFNAGPGPGAQFNGMVASILGDYGTGGLVTPGSGTATTGVFVDGAGSTLTLSGAAILQLDNLFMDIWQNVYLSPKSVVMSAQMAQDIANKVFGTSAALTYLLPENVSGRREAVIGGSVGHIINKAAGGAVVDIVIEPHMPPGLAIARTDSIPFPGANIDSAWKVRTLRDYAQYDYGSNYNPGTSGGGPREDFEIRAFETLACRAPGAQGVLAGVANG